MLVSIVSFSLSFLMLLLLVSLSGYSFRSAFGVLVSSLKRSLSGFAPFRLFREKRFDNSGFLWKEGL